MENNQSLDINYNPEFDGSDCLAHAKKIVNQLRQENRNALIFYIQDPIVDPNCKTGHYWVVPNPGNPEDTAYNNTQDNGRPLYPPVTNKEVLQKGENYPY